MRKKIKSAVSQFLQGKYSIDLQDTDAGLAGPGLAFASHTDFIKKNQFYDAAIVGGGDSFFFHALMNNIDELFYRRFFSKQHKNHFKEWYKKLNKDNKIGYLPNKIYHMYHGEIKNRQYVSRELILFNHQYDPDLHIEISDNQIWKFTNPHNNPLKDEILNYMKSRKDN
jgi:hypothetical protein